MKNQSIRVWSVFYNSGNLEGVYLSETAADFWAFLTTGASVRPGWFHPDPPKKKPAKKKGKAK